MKKRYLWLLLVCSSAWAVDLPAARPVSARKPVLRIAPHVVEPLEPLLQRAYQAYGRGDFTVSDLLYQQVLQQEALNLDALLGLAAIAQHRGDSAAAMQYYSRVLAIDPHNALGHAGLSAYVGNEESESDLKAWLQAQPNSASLHFALGNHFAREMRWSEAQQAYFTAHRLAPLDAEVAFNLAVSLEHLGQPKQAVVFYRRALALDPEQHADIEREQLARHVEQLEK